MLLSSDSISNHKEVSPLTKSAILSLDAAALADVLEQTHVSESLDLGLSIVHSGRHPVHGGVTIISTCGDTHAMLITG